MEKQGNYFDLILNETTVCVITKSLVGINDYYYY